MERIDVRALSKNRDLKEMAELALKLIEKYLTMEHSSEKYDIINDAQYLVSELERLEMENRMYHRINTANEGT